MPPVARAHQLMQTLGEGFGEAVGKRLEHDGAVVVVVGLEARQMLLDADSGGQGEGAEVIRATRGARGDIIGETEIGLVALGAADHLLA